MKAVRYLLHVDTTDLLQVLQRALQQLVILIWVDNLICEPGLHL